MKASRRALLLAALLALGLAAWLPHGDGRQQRTNYDMSFRLFNREVLGLTVRELPVTQWRQGERHEEK